jgi:uncharacterized membrane protein YdjX (TVP38/TMEM64 family)
VERAAPEQERQRRRQNQLRLIALALVAIALFAAGHASGFSSRATEARALILRSGGWGVLLYAALFALGVLIHIPGMAFVATGVILWGRVQGGVYAYAGALAATLVSFVLVRAIGGQPLAELRGPRIRAILDRLKSRPILAVAAVRALTMTLPAANYTLALSSVSLPAYLVGSALGLIPSVAVVTVLSGVLFK